MNKVKNAVPAPTGAAGKGKPETSEELDPEFQGLMSEIETDLRADEFKKIWKRYGNVFIAFAILLVLGVSGAVMYRNNETKNREAAARRYELAVTAQQDGKTDEAMTGFTTLTKDGGKAYSMLARFALASLQFQKQDFNGAIATYKSLAEDPAVEPAFRDLATVLWVQHALDREDPKTLEAVLTPLTSPNNTFNLSALELTALLAAKEGDTARAVKTLAQITTDPMAPASMRERAQDLTKLYQAGNLPPPPAAPTTTAPSAPAPAASVPTPPATSKP